MNRTILTATERQELRDFEAFARATWGRSLYRWERARLVAEKRMNARLRVQLAALRAS